MSRVHGRRSRTNPLLRISQIPIEPVERALLLDEWQNAADPAHFDTRIRVHDAADIEGRRQPSPLRVGKVQTTKGQLLEIGAAQAPPRRLAGSLDGRQQEADEDADDRDHGQKFDQRKRSPAAGSGPESPVVAPHDTPPEKRAKNGFKKVK
jgi:hypothetical protein